MCYRFATIVKAMMTSKDQELHLPRCTTAQAPIWLGYLHTPKNVLTFSASQIKNPISTNANSNGM